MHFVDEIVAIGMDIAVRGETKELVEKRAKLWANATDKDLVDYARYTAEKFGATFANSLKRAQKTRERFKKQIAEQI